MYTPRQMRYPAVRKPISKKSNRHLIEVYQESRAEHRLVISANSSACFQQSTYKTVSGNSYMLTLNQNT